nr:hypothetical protein BaRGS_001476 [Batillaria attramentaria]
MALDPQDAPNRTTPGGSSSDRRRPKETWRRTVDKELKENKLTWGTLEKKTQNRPEWRSLVSALCARVHEGD